RGAVLAGPQGHRLRLPLRPVDRPTAGRPDRLPPGRAFSPALPQRLAGRAALQPAEARGTRPRAARAPGPTLDVRALPPPAKKSADGHAHRVLIDESGFRLGPLVRRTQAPVGQTPILEVPGRSRERVSVIAALTVSPLRRHLSLYWRTLPGGHFGSAEVADF